MERAGGVEQSADVAVAGFGPEPAGDPKVVPVAVVLPPALFCDGFEDLSSGAPAFLRRLWQIANGELLSGLRQETFGGLLVLLGGDLGFLLLCEQVSDCGTA